ncbi:MAG: DUF4430 domain-containing protein [Oscillospiraceae bacterium]|nr:DUF4430 domain-containing protein [Oscillospiraceae bacterium]
MKMEKKTGIVLAVLVLLVAAAVSARVFLSPKAQQGAKTITVAVEHLEGEDKTFTHSTDCEYLRGAMEEMGIIEGEESTYGMWVTAIDGETADESKQQWWGYSVNGEFSSYGVDSQVIADGDVFTFTLNVGY